MKKVVSSILLLATLFSLGYSAPSEDTVTVKESVPTKICPKIEEFVDINLDKYIGKKWYSVYRPSELDHEWCTTYKYILDKDDNGKLKPFLNKTITYKSNSTAPRCHDSDKIELAILSSNDYKGTVFAYEDLFPLADHSYNYTVIATDYESYSIEYRCENGEGPQIWVHSIEPQLNAENEKLVQHSLKLRGLPALETLNKVNHSECAKSEQQCTKNKIK